MKRTGTINLYSSYVAAWDKELDEPGMQAVYMDMLRFMHGRGWTIRADPDCVKNHRSISKWTRLGRKGDLEAVIHVCGVQCEVELFQNVANVDNQYGGRYCTGKFGKMPRRLRIPCAVELGAIVRAFEAMGYAPNGRNGFTRTDNLHVLRRAEDDFSALTPMDRFNRVWGSDRFKRDESGWPVVSEYDSCHDNRDRDGKPVRNGQTKYARIRGRLMRGTVYTNMNSMWQLCYGGSVTYLSSWELFDCDHPETEPRRMVAGQKDRLRAELEKAMKREDYKRVERLARMLEHVS
jgi:hypothetical protein